MAKDVLTMEGREHLRDRWGPLMCQKLMGKAIQWEGRANHNVLGLMCLYGLSELEALEAHDYILQERGKENG